MALPNLFSRRRRLAAGPASDIYSYNALPPKVRVQILQIAGDAISYYCEHGAYGSIEPQAEKLWDKARSMMRRELGVFQLVDKAYDAGQEVGSWFMTHDKIDELIDMVEILFWIINDYVRRSPIRSVVASKMADQAILELNARLREASIGYEFVPSADEIIRIDNTILHDQVIMPVIMLLADPLFTAANTEYLAAHAAYRQGDFEAAITECGKAFESVLKTISAARGWGTAANATANPLVKAAFDNQFVPSLMQSQFSGLRALLESGTQALRNASGGHGAGTTPRTIPRHLAAYQLHQTASVIQFLVEQHRSLP